jgi:hypothetical protein
MMRSDLGFGVVLVGRGADGARGAWRAVLVVEGGGALAVLDVRGMLGVADADALGAAELVDVGELGGALLGASGMLGAADTGALGAGGSLGAVCAVEGIAGAAVAGAPFGLTSATTNAVPASPSTRPPAPKTAIQ